MSHKVVYIVLLAACCGYVLRRGSWPEYAAAAILLIGTLATHLARSAYATRFRSIETGVLIVDVVALIAFLILALVAERYWPIWITGLQGAAVASNIPSLIPGQVTPFAYAVVLALWSYPMLILLAVGTSRHRRRLAAYGADPSWKPFFDRWLRAVRPFARSG